MATDLARALCPGFVPGINSIAYLFLDPMAKKVLPDRPQLLRETVARLRFNSGNGTDPEGLQRLVDHLCARSAEFRALWSRHEVLETWRGPIRIWHAAVGIVGFERVPLIVASSPAYRLHMLHPSDDRAAQALTLIAQLEDPT